MLVRLVQLLKASSPIEVTVLGIVIVVNPHPEKVPPGIVDVIKPLGISVKAVPEKALIPSVVIVPFIVIFERAEQLPKAEVPIVLTLAGRVTLFS